jgi:hypothetical protein
VAILAVIMIMISGLQWIFSAGNPPAMAKAKDQMMSAILGLILVLICIPLLKMINPALVRLSSFKIPAIAPREEYARDPKVFYDLIWSKFVFPKDGFGPGAAEIGASKCGTISEIKVGGKKKVAIGTVCEPDNFCLLSFYGDVTQYEDLVEDDIETQKDTLEVLLDKERTKCIKNNNEFFKLMDYATAERSTYLSKSMMRCGELEKIPNYAGTKCDGSWKCLYMEVEVSVSDMVGGYGGGWCAYYPPVACPLGMKRVNCSECKIDSLIPPNCTDEIEPVKGQTICCEKDGQTQLIEYKKE